MRTRKQYLITFAFESSPQNDSNYIVGVIANIENSRCGITAYLRVEKGKIQQYFRHYHCYNPCICLLLVTGSFCDSSLKLVAFIRRVTVVCCRGQGEFAPYSFPVWYFVFRKVLIPYYRPPYITENRLKTSFKCPPSILLCGSIRIHIYSLKSGRNLTSPSRKINVFLYSPISRNERKGMEGDVHTDDQMY